MNDIISNDVIDKAKQKNNVGGVGVVDVAQAEGVRKKHHKEKNTNKQGSAQGEQQDLVGLFCKEFLCGILRGNEGVLPEIDAQQEEESNNQTTRPTN